MTYKIITADNDIISTKEYLEIARMGAIDEPTYDTEIEEANISENIKNKIWNWMDFYKTNFNRLYSEGRVEEVTNIYNPDNLIKMSKEELKEIEDSIK
jgi:hypothetical protein